MLSQNCNCRQPGLGGDCDGSCQHPPGDFFEEKELTLEDRDRALDNGHHSYLKGYGRDENPYTTQYLRDAWFEGYDG